MSKIHIKIMSENAIAYLKKNIESITNMIIEHGDNKWIYNEFPQPLFIEKTYEIEEFELTPNPNSSDKEIDYKNSILIYENLKNLPRYVITSEGFWLWMHFEKHYAVVKEMMAINGTSTVLDHWTLKQGTRRGLMFGVLSRCFFRVALTVDEKASDKYEYTRWIINNPLRFRELSWRSYSSENHLVRGIIKGEKAAIDEEPTKEQNNIYALIAKDISEEGSIKLLDAISEDDIKAFTYKKMKEYLA